MKKDINSKCKKDDDYCEKEENQQEIELLNEKLKQKEQEKQLKLEDKKLKKAAEKAHYQIQQVQEVIQQQMVNQLRHSQRKQQKYLQEGDIEAAIQEGQQTSLMFCQADAMMEELQQEEQKIVNYRINMHLGKTKTIQCMFCGHKGQSYTEDYFSYLSLVIIFVELYLTWDMLCIFYSFVQFFFIIPLISQILKVRSHSCKNCLNEVKQSSIFKYLDLEDEMVELHLGKIGGIIIKRRTMLYMLILILTMYASSFVLNFNETDMLVKVHPEAILHEYSIQNNVNYELNWIKYLESDNKDQHLNQVVKWDGRVLRVDTAQDEELYYCQILVRMNPRWAPKEQKSGNWPDLVIWLDELEFEQQVETIDKMQRGTPISVIGEIIKPDIPEANKHYEDIFPHLDGFKVEIIPGYNQKDLDSEKNRYESVVHEDGRYKNLQHIDLENN